MKQNNFEEYLNTCNQIKESNHYAVDNKDYTVNSFMFDNDKKG